MAESLLMGKEEREDMEKKLKMKKEVFDKIEIFVRHSTHYAKMLKFNGNLCACQKNFFRRVITS